MSSPRSSTSSNRSHRHSGSASPTTSPRSRSSSTSSPSLKRKSLVCCVVCLKETIPMLSRSTLFSIQNYCSMTCYSKSVNETNGNTSSTSSSSFIGTSSLESSSNSDLPANATTEPSYRKFSFNSNGSKSIQV